jgi:hypothetical protein
VGEARAVLSIGERDALLDGGELFFDLPEDGRDIELEMVGETFLPTSRVVTI